MTAPENISAEEGTQDECILPRVIFIRATMSGLLYPLLPFAMLKENHIVEVQQYIEQYNVDTRNSMMMRSAWNKPFNAVSSDSIYFVCAWNSVPEATPNTQGSRHDIYHCLLWTASHTLAHDAPCVARHWRYGCLVCRDKYACTSIRARGHTLRGEYDQADA